jgi:4-methyl-5(b-hydroxyethyl)-thiazole monophosphate biosynthesis
MFDDILGKTFDMLVIPGGTTNYAEHEGLLKLVMEQHENGRKLAAICAAPCVLGKLGLLKGKRAIIYPGMEELLGGATLSPKIVETDGNITTSKGPGATVYFALRLVEILVGREIADDVAEKFIVMKISI